MHVKKKKVKVKGSEHTENCLPLTYDTSRTKQAIPFYNNRNYTKQMQTIAYEMSITIIAGPGLKKKKKKKKKNYHTHKKKK